MRALSPAPRGGLVNAPRRALAQVRVRRLEQIVNGMDWNRPTYETLIQPNGPAFAARGDMGPVLPLKMRTR